MTQLHPALDAALSADQVTIFAALTIELPSVTLRLLDASAEIEIDSDLYTGEDALGTWNGIDEFEDGTGDEAPGMMVTLLPANDDAALTLTNPLVQGSPVTVMLGARDDTTGLSIGEPYLLFAGEIDVPLHRFGGSLCAVDYECVGGMERLFFADEGIRLAQSWHEQVWPGELGFEHVTGVDENVYWGGAASSSGGFMGAAQKILFGFFS